MSRASDNKFYKTGSYERARVGVTVAARLEQLVALDVLEPRVALDAAGRAP